MATIKNCENLVARENSDGSHTITLKNVRGSYLHLFKPWSKNESETKKYSGRFIAPNDTHEAAIKTLRAYLKDLQKEWFKGAIKPGNLCFRDGDQEGKEEYADAWILAANENADAPPAIVGPDRRKLTESDGVPQSGDYVSVMFKVWKQDNDYGQRINANLRAVQFIKEGERFGGSKGASKEDLDEGFDELEVAEEDGFED